MHIQAWNTIWNTLEQWRHISNASKHKLDLLQISAFLSNCQVNYPKASKIASGMICILDCIKKNCGQQVKGRDSPFWPAIQLWGPHNKKDLDL